MDAQFPFSIFLFLCSKFFYHLVSLLRSAKMIMFHHQVIPGILEPQLSLWNPRMSLGGECVCRVDPRAEEATTLFLRQWFATIKERQLGGTLLWC